MNRDHLELLRSDLWRTLLADHIIPFALADIAWADLGDDVLEIGPGPGLTTDLLSASVPRLTAIELDSGLADDLRGRMGSVVDVIEGDASAMTFPDARFSAVVSFTMLHHVPTAELQDRLFAEAHRVLRPGGILVASDSVASADLAALHVDDTYNPVDPDELSVRLEGAGFVDVEVRSNAFGWACHAHRPAPS